MSSKGAFSAMQAVATSKFKMGWGKPAATAARPTATVYAFAAAPPAHPAVRMAAPPSGSGPKLRAAGSAYRPTGFRRPIISSVSSMNKLQHRVLTSAARMPDNFCWQPQDLTTTLDQGSCGTCWAHAMVSMLGDRVSAATNGKIRVALNVRQTQECSEYLDGATKGGCDGNDPYTALMSLQTRNMPLRAQGKYVREYEAKPTDPNACVAIKTGDSDYAVGVSQAFAISEKINKVGDAAHVGNIENMKQHIYNEGPIIGTFEVRSDFSDYDGLTIYEPSAQALKDDSLGYHAIEIVGWGKDPDSGVSYWVCRNSWGDKWPQKHRKCAGQGFFYFRMGSNTCSIESYSAGAIPVVFNSDKAPKDEGNLYPGEKACAVNEKGVTVASWQLSKTNIIEGAVVVALIAGGVYIYMQKKKGKYILPFTIMGRRY